MPIINTVIKGSGGSAPAHYIEKSVDANGVLGAAPVGIDLSGVTDLAPYSLAYAGYIAQFSGAALLNTTSLTKISGMYALDFAFYSTNVTSTGLNNVEEVSGLLALENAFCNCSNITTMGLDNLKTLSGTRCLNSCFTGTGLIEARFTKLDEITADNVFALNQYSSCFARCYYLQNVYFNAVKSSTFSTRLSALQYLFNQDTGSMATGGCTVHFPSNFDPSNPNKTFDITTLAGYPTFGGDANYIHLAYDLPATE